MPSHYDNKENQIIDEPAAPSTPAPEKKKRNMTKLTDKQKADLKKHMEKHKKDGMSTSEIKSHRMKMMARMRKGMSIKKAHSDILKSEIY